MTKEQKRSLILASIIGTLFACYADDEKTKLHDELHRRIGKGVRKQVRLFGEDAVKVVAHNEGNKIWGEAVEHFKERGITIEASSCVLALWNLDEKPLSKHYGLSAGKLGTWAKPSTRSDAAQLEKAGNELARYIYNTVNTLYGIETVQKLSVLERIKKAKEEIG